MSWECKDFGINKVLGITKVANIQVQIPDEFVKKGNFYWEDNSKKAHQHKQKVLQLIDDALENNCQLIILPELSTSLSIEEHVREKLQELPAERSCIVVCGSYYRERKHYSPILCKVNNQIETIYQRKLFPSESEVNFMDKGSTRYVLWNTGLGDITVLICYDANDWVLFKHLQDLVDIVVVIAYNPSLTKFKNRFVSVCYEHYYSIVLCNDGKYGDSSLFIPCRKTFQSQFSYKTIPASGHDNKRSWLSSLMFWKKPSVGLEKNWEGISIFSLDIQALDQARAKSRRSIENRQLAYPPKSIVGSRYTPERKTNDFFRKIIKQRTTKFLPPNAISVLVDTSKQLYYQLEKQIVTLGRHALENDVCLSYQSVSRRHALIAYRQSSNPKEPEFFIFDCDSYNGVEVNKTKVTAQIDPKIIDVQATKGKPLRDGAIINLSEDVSLQFRRFPAGLQKDLETLTQSCCGDDEPLTFWKKIKLIWQIVQGKNMR